MSMKERSIIFKAPEVRAILKDGTVQIQRLVKPQPVGYPPFYLIETSSGHGMYAASGKHQGLGMGRYDAGEGSFELYDAFTKRGGLAWQGGGRTHWRCPYGKPGDRLWVRETWRAGKIKHGKRPAILYEYRSTPETGQVTLFEHDVLPQPSKGNGWRNAIYMPRLASRLNVELTEVQVRQLTAIPWTAVRAEGADRSACTYPDPWVWAGKFKRVTT